MMKKIVLIVFLLFVAFVALASAQPKAYPQVVATVIKVVDGDTLKIKYVGVPIPDTVRIKGIDCPESRRNKKCLRSGKKACELEVVKGKAATRFMRQLLAGKTVTLVAEGDEFKRDHYNRLLAYVELDEADVGLRSIQEGYCRDYSDRYPHPRSDIYKAKK
jgi:endonuclease YncB( thermonuclease family)